MIDSDDRTTPRPSSKAMVVATQAGGTGAALVAENVLRYGSAIFAARALGDSGFGVAACRPGIADRAGRNSDMSDKTSDLSVLLL